MTRVEEASPSERAELKDGQGGVGRRNRREGTVMRVLNPADVKVCATSLLDRGGFYFHLLTIAILGLVLELKGRDLDLSEWSLQDGLLDPKSSHSLSFQSPLARVIPTVPRKRSSRHPSRSTPFPTPSRLGTSTR